MSEYIARMPRFGIKENPSQDVTLATYEPVSPHGWTAVIRSIGDPQFELEVGMDSIFQTEELLLLDLLKHYGLQAAT